MRLKASLLHSGPGGISAILVRKIRRPITGTVFDPFFLHNILLPVVFHPRLHFLCRAFFKPDTSSRMTFCNRKEISASRYHLSQAVITAALSLLLLAFAFALFLPGHTWPYCNHDTRVRQSIDHVSSLTSYMKDKSSSIVMLLAGIGSAKWTGRKARAIRIMDRHLRFLPLPLSLLVFPLEGLPIR